MVSEVVMVSELVVVMVPELVVVMVPELVVVMVPELVVVVVFCCGSGSCSVVLLTQS
jgi:uncharacterized membrane protein